MSVIEAMLAVEMFRRGMDTFAIAHVMRKPEAVVYNILALRAA